MSEPRCPYCGGPLTRRWFTDVWNEDGSPSERYEDLYCGPCEIRWVPMDTEPDGEEAEG